MNRADWLAARRLGVSGTDIATLLGLNPWKTVDQLVLDKLGISKPFKGNPLTEAGKKLEAHVANWYAERNKAVLIGGVFTASSTEPRFIGTPDFLHTDYVLEIKTGSSKTFASGCPPYYECQCRWYMMILEKDKALLEACIVPKDRSEIPFAWGEAHIADWVKYQPHQQYQWDRNPAWEEQAQEVALAFLERLEKLRQPLPQ